MIFTIRDRRKKERDKIVKKQKKSKIWQLVDKFISHPPVVQEINENIKIEVQETEFLFKEK